MPRDHNFLLTFIGRALIIAGAGMLLSFGIKDAKPYVASKHMLEAQCTVTKQVFSHSRHNWKHHYVKCRCVEDDDDCHDDSSEESEGKSEETVMNRLDNYCTYGRCYSYFPCLRVTVSYTLGDKQIVNATLYKSYYYYRRSQSGLLLSKLGESCYMSPCDEDIDDNEDPVRLLSRWEKNTRGAESECFYDPESPGKVIQWRPRLWQAIVSTGVPALALIIGVFIELYSWGCLCRKYSRVPVTI